MTTIPLQPVRASNERNLVMEIILGDIITGIHEKGAPLVVSNLAEQLDRGEGEVREALSALRDRGAVVALDDGAVVSSGWVGADIPGSIVTLGRLGAMVARDHSVPIREIALQVADEDEPAVFVGFARALIGCLTERTSRYVLRRHIDPVQLAIQPSVLAMRGIDLGHHRDGRLRLLADVLVYATLGRHDDTADALAAYSARLADAMHAEG